MKDEELKEMVAGLAGAIKNVTREADRRALEADRRHEETERLFEKLAQDADQRARDADQRARDADQRQARLDRQLKDLRDNIGGLSNKFGSFTEALASPSMEKLLMEEFGMEFVELDVRRRRGPRRTQIDALAYSNTGRDAVYVVEVKSRLTSEGILQILRILENFFDFFPEHRGKKLYAILAAVEAPEELQIRVLERGIYLAQINDEIFQLEVPEDFQPRSFSE